MNDKLISIIVPVYNTEKILEKCLKSIVNQTYKNLEIILIDDGSTDNSGIICDEYAKKDSRFRVFHILNKGVSNARNIGITIFRGIYATFIDSDDWIEPNYIEYMYNLITSENVDFVRCNYCINYTYEKEIKNIGQLYGLENKKFYKKNLENGLLKHFLLYNKSIPNYSFLLMIKGNLLKKIKFNTNLFMMEDADFYLSLFINSNSFYLSNKVLYHYYINDSGATRLNDKCLKNMVGIIETNSVLQEKLKKSFEISNIIIPKMNAAHLYLIFTYFIKYCVNHDIDDTLNKLKQNKEYINIVNNINYDELPFIKAKITKLFVLNDRLLLKVLVMIYKLKK